MNLFFTKFYFRIFKANDGFSLIIVLLVIGFLSAVALAIAVLTQSTLNAKLHQKDILQVRLLADAGINRAIVALETTDDPFKLEKPLLRTTSRQLSLQSALINIRIEPESGKLDINYAQIEHIDNLLKKIGIELSHSTKIVNNLVDARKKKYSFQDVMEIVEPKERLGSLSIILPRYLTAVRNTASFDPRSADSIILETIPSIEPKELEALYRLKEGTQVESLREVLSRHSMRFSLPQPIYRIVVEAILPNGITSRREAMIMLKANGLGAHVLSWKTTLAPLEEMSKDP